MNDNMIIVKVENKNQLDLLLNDDRIDEIILSRDSFNENELWSLIDKIKKHNKQAGIMLERISRYEDTYGENLRKSTDRLLDINNLDKIIIENLDSFSYILRKINVVSNKNLVIELDYTMNIANNCAKKVFEKLYNEKRENASEVPLRFTTSLELNKYELTDINFDTYVGYGYIPTMVSANCLRKNQGAIDCKCKYLFDKVCSHEGIIRDRLNKDVHYKTYCKYCYNKVYNVSPLYIVDLIDNKNLRYDFTFETNKEIIDILNKKMPRDFTRGHYNHSMN